MSDRIVIRPYQAGDETAILNAFNRIFPARRTLAEWRWLYQDNPDQTAIMMALGEDGKVVAHYAGTLRRGYYQGKEVKLGYMHDIFTTASHRAWRKGKSTLIGLVADEFFARWMGPGRGIIGYGFPNFRHFRLGNLTMQYRPFSHWWHGVYTLESQPSIPSAPLELFEIKRFDHPLNTIEEGQKETLAGAAIRNADFLNWRLFDKPSCKYRVWGCRQFLAEELDGYLVFNDNGRRAGLVDFMLPSEPRAALCFWRRVAEKLGVLGITRIECWLSAGNLSILEQLRAIGFKGQLVNDKEGMIPVFRCFDPALDHDWCDRNFYFTMIDSDLV